MSTSICLITIRYFLFIDIDHTRDFEELLQTINDGGRPKAMTVRRRTSVLVSVIEAGRAALPAEELVYGQKEPKAQCPVFDQPKSHQNRKSDIAAAINTM
jgi:hypothetical protein